jgi:hypothetical protein
LAFRASAGNSALLAGIVIMTAAATAQRKGRLWAWILMWALVAHALADLVLAIAHRAAPSFALAWDIIWAVSVTIAQLIATPMPTLTRQPSPEFPT